jgi:hypothetical protein
MRSGPSRQYSFEDRIAEEMRRLEEQASLLPNGLPKNQLLRKIRQLETASHLNECLPPIRLRPQK